MLLLLHADGRTRSVPLVSSTLIGRGPACHARVRDPSVPLYWLEIRWLGDGWGWRALGADLHTRGQGAPDAAGWRRLRTGAGRSHRVTLGEHVWIELVHDGPPESFVMDVTTGERVTGELLERIVEMWPERMLPVAADGDPTRALEDGEIFVADGRAYRAWLPTVVDATRGTRMDVRDTVHVDIDVEQRRATFSQGGSEVVVRGECVRVLAVYAAARDADPARGGWLTPTEAWEAWVAMGAEASAPLERLGWERTRLRGALARARVGGLEALFETQRDGMEWRIRLGERVRTG
jgi:hypothetical protein